MNPFGPKIKLALVLGVIAGACFVGWQSRGWFEDSKDLAAVEAQQALAAEIRTDMGKVVQTVEGQLQGLKANERVIDRGIIREIQTPVYRNVCIPPDGDPFRLLNDLAAGKAASEPDDQGSTDTAATD